MRVLIWTVPRRVYVSYWLSTAECPVCRGVFDIDTIETHASDCGICSSDKEGNVGISSGQIRSFQRSSQRCSVRFRPGLCARPVMFFYTELDIPAVMEVIHD
ncbi:hypothetical protein AMECASPLE_038731 [Ameca splendens]|uniref:Uncharacterized protein n=1 Tax=Ameca splendens TaxID=208324 RepID=A0ABV0ZUL8_9TELE